MIGADSHTPAAAGLSMLAIGAGGLDVALAMAGRPYYLPCPKVLGVKLIGTLPDWVSAKDIILEMLRRYGVKGCLGMVVEYYGPGVATLVGRGSGRHRQYGNRTGCDQLDLSRPMRIPANIWPPKQREADWRPMAADAKATYDETTRSIWPRLSR